MAAEERKRRPGRPALFENLPTDVICRNVTRYLKLGVSHEQAAVALGISVDTFYDWIKKYRQFSEAVKAGEIDADAEMASAMYRAGTGNKRIVEQFVKLKDGPDRERVEVVEVEIEDPLNVSAQIFWLKNRRRDLWKDMRSTEMSGPDGRAIELEHNHTFPARQLPPEERDQLRAFLEQHVTDVEDQNDLQPEEVDDGDDDGSESRD